MKINENVLVISDRKEFDEFLDSAEEISSVPYKHDMSCITCVFEYESSFWKMSYLRSYEYGVEVFFPKNCQKVEKKLVQVEKWVEVAQ